MATLMRHHSERTKAIITHIENNNNTTDVYCGSDYLDTVFNKKIQENDIMLQISLDGAQLFRDKESDCFMYVYVIHNLPPDIRYKKRYVIPGGLSLGLTSPRTSTPSSSLASATSRHCRTMVYIFGMCCKDFALSAAFLFLCFQQPTVRPWLIWLVWLATVASMAAICIADSLAAIV
jgi:hypothetical protein